MARDKANSGAWDGSNVQQDHLNFLCDTRRLPGTGYVEARVPPAKEITPAPKDGEYVIFRSHFLCGFGLPASEFLRLLMDFYGVQPHHLMPNMVVLFSAFVTLCEGYLSTLPTLELRAELFYLKLGTSTKGEAVQCGACVAMRRSGTGAGLAS